MEKLKVNGFQVIGISVRTSNLNGQAKNDIGQLWNRFMSENLMEKIPNIVDESIFALYTDYEGDHTEPYTAVLGYKVSSLATVPEGMKGVKINDAEYTKLVAKGDLTEDAVVNEWLKVWNMDIDRTYATDFEVYGEKAQNPKNGEADIFVGVDI